LYFAFLSVILLCQFLSQRERAEAREKSKKEEKPGEAAATDKSKGSITVFSDAAAKKERVEAKQKPRETAAASPHPPIPECAVSARELTEQEKQVPDSGFHVFKFTALLHWLFVRFVDSSFLPVFRQPHLPPS
jgi:hypothetical protein